MARKPMVTRTIQSTTVTALCMDIVTAEPCNRTLTIPRAYKTEKDIMKVVKPIIETVGDIRVVAIVDTSVNEALYGMTEQEFLEHAHLMPPRSSGEEETTTEEG